jgi:LruC domain-containing protein
MAQGGEIPAIINKEVHLVNHPPTNRATTTATPFLFGLNVPGNDDNSFAQNPAGGVFYYKTKPTSEVPNSFWALDINETANPTAVGFLWPVEGRKISDAYPQFADWASSGGTKNTSWYLPANIDTQLPLNSNVYTK